MTFLFNLFLFAVSFLLTALLTPPIEVEDAKKNSLDPKQFPVASEDDPVALLLGCVRLRGPNVIDYGGFRSVPLTEKVKTGFFTSEKVKVGYKYYLSIDMGLCLGPNIGLKEIYIDSVLVEEGTDYYNTGTSLISTKTIGLNTSGSFSISSQLGISEAQLNTLTNAGGLTMEAEFTFTCTNYFGDPAAGTWGITGQFKETDGTTTVDPPEGFLAMSDQDSTPGAGQYILTVTVPHLAQYLNWTTIIAPAVLLGFNAVYSINEVRFYENVTELGEVTSDINKPQLYGGKKEGGGHVGNFTFYPGSFTQTVNSEMETLGGGSGSVPAYRGTSHIVLEDNYIGETPQLRKMEFTCFCYTDYLSNGYGGRIATDADDADPMEILYEVLTSEWRGLGVATSKFNLTSFQTASTTLISEGAGMSLLITAAQSGKKVVQEILKQVNGLLYVDMTTGKINIKLIRDDYIPSALTVYDEDDIVAVRSFKKTSWEDVRSQVKVSFSSNDKDSTRIAIAQDMAVTNMIGQLKTANISFPFCYDPDLASALATRELAAISIPLYKMTVEMNRNAYDLLPGDVIKVSWADYGLTEVIFRVQKADLGELLDNRVVVDLVQDVFAANTVVYASPEDTGWTDDRPVPQVIYNYAVIDMPYFFSSQLQFPIADGYGDVIPFAPSPQVGSTAFSFLTSEVTGGEYAVSPDGALYPVTGLFNGAYSKLAGFENGLDATGFTVDGITGGEDATPTNSTEAQIKAGVSGLIYANGEWMGFKTATDNGGGSWTFSGVYRGLLGTIPVDHADNSRWFILSNVLLGTGSRPALVEDGNIYFKLLDQVGGEIQDASEFSEVTQALGDVADRPLRPRLISLDGARTAVPYNFSADFTVNVTWVNSNRAAGQVTLEDDATETPDQAEQYDLEVWIDGAQDMALSDTNITSPYALDMSSATGTQGELRLYATRTGGDTKSSVLYAWYPFLLSVTADSTELTTDSTQVTADKT